MVLERKGVISGKYDMLAFWGSSTRLLFEATWSRQRSLARGSKQRTALQW
jgi:hypothetical protein